MSPGGERGGGRDIPAVERLGKGNVANLDCRPVSFRENRVADAGRGEEGAAGGKRDGSEEEEANDQRSKKVGVFMGP